MREREKESVSYKKTRQIASSLAGFHCVCVSKILNDLIDSFRYMVFKRDLVQYNKLRLHLCVCNNSKNSIFIFLYYILYCLVFIVVLYPTCLYFQLLHYAYVTLARRVSPLARQKLLQFCYVSFSPTDTDRQTARQTNISYMCIGICMLWRFVFFGWALFENVFEKCFQFISGI